MQTRNRLFDDLAKVASGAASTVVGIKQEVESIVQQQMERLADELGFVRRDEFDAVHALAVNARAAVEQLEERIAVLEARLAAAEASEDNSEAGR